MRKKLHLLLLMVLVSSNLSVGEDSSKNKDIKVGHKNPSKSHFKTKANVDRNKRSLDDEEDKPFWANRGKKQSEESYLDNQIQKPNNKVLRNENNGKEPPFWGNRGRRDSASVENYVDDIDYPISEPKIFTKGCKHCPDTFSKFLVSRHLFENRNEDINPFWGNRGRRNSDEVENIDDIRDSLPFWGNRGRRQEDEPFWGARGRREEEPFWGNRGRRKYLWNNHVKRNKIKEITEEEEDPFWGNRGRRKDLKDSIHDAINDVEQEIVHLSQDQSDQSSNPLALSNTKTSFWNSKGRDSKLQHLFNGSPRQKFSFSGAINNERHPVDSSTLTDSKIYAEEPHYILVERSSRSSGEVDPFYISRGKKMNFLNLDSGKAARDRRGAIEDIVKSVKTDPYFIVRGKKGMNDNNTKADNSTALHYKYAKAKELICATVDIMLMKKEVKREGPDSDRGRRAILNKLAAQLQIDPYFVSRGKKSNDWTNKDEYLAEFLDQVAEMCN